MYDFAHSLTDALEGAAAPPPPHTRLRPSPPFDTATG